MKPLQLHATKRSVTGRKVKKLRHGGVLPATVYGKATKPTSVEVSADEFIQIFQKRGMTGLIQLSVDGEERPVLVKKVQLDPVSGLPLHVEFHQVSLKDKIRANVPIVVTGEAQAVKEKVGTLLQLLDEIEVEALATDLPERIEVNISGLAHVNDHVTVKELHVPNEVTPLTDQDIMVVKIGELLAPEPEPTPAPVEGETVEGGEASVSEKSEEKASEETSSKPEELVNKE